MSSNNGQKPTYWHVKAAFLEARLAIATAEAKLADTLRAAGLDPAVAYKLVDEDESIRPLVQPPPREG